jgi:phosphoglycolate phosphatase-like HAD superfamily hydrolase
MLNNFSSIFWDFDGVILNSDKVRTDGFRHIFENYSKQEVDKLIDYHTINGGLSRYDKIEYFSQKISKKKISEKEKFFYIQLYGNYCRDRLCNKSLLIHSSIDFIKENYESYNFHLVSASDEKELSYLCSKLDIEKYFKSISGSPVNKILNLKKLLRLNNYLKSKCCLIGDSINDKDAAMKNGITFFGFNNKDLIKDSKYIYSFTSLNK